MKIFQIGDKFNRLTIIGDKKLISYGRKQWPCKCDCGNTKIVYAETDKLENGRVKSCGCYSRELARLGKHRLPEGQAAENELYAQYQRKRGDIEWKIDRKFFRKLIYGDCFYCGSKPSQTFGEGRLNGFVTYNGIDRIDNNKGYVAKNVVSCCRDCNYIKGTLRYNDFLVKVNKIYNYYFFDKSPERQFTNTKNARAKFELLRRYKNNAENGHREWGLSDHDFFEIVNSSCHYCGTEPNQSIYCSIKDFYFYNGVDRIDNDKPYFKENCLACCGVCNFMKRTMGREDFMSKIKEIYENRFLCKDN